MARGRQRAPKPATGWAGEPIVAGAKHWRRFVTAAPDKRPPSQARDPGVRSCPTRAKDATTDQRAAGPRGGGPQG